MRSILSFLGKTLAILILLCAPALRANEWGQWTTSTVDQGLQSRVKYDYFNKDSKLHVWKIQVRNRYKDRWIGVNWQFEGTDTSGGRFTLGPGSLDESWAMTTVGSSKNRIGIQWTEMCVGASKSDVYGCSGTPTTAPGTGGAKPDPAAALRKQQEEQAAAQAKQAQEAQRAREAEEKAKKDEWTRNAQKQQDDNAARARAALEENRRQWELSQQRAKAQRDALASLGAMVNQMFTDRAMREQDKQIKENLKRLEGGNLTRCNSCGGTGYSGCDKCGGRGIEECSMCLGRGEVGYGQFANKCTMCGGAGKSACGSCKGTAREECPDCNGEGRIRTLMSSLQSGTNGSNVSRKGLDSGDGCVISVIFLKNGLPQFPYDQVRELRMYQLPSNQFIGYLEANQITKGYAIRGLYIGRYVVRFLLNGKPMSIEISSGSKGQWVTRPINID